MSSLLFRVQRRGSFRTPTEAISAVAPLIQALRTLPTAPAIPFAPSSSPAPLPSAPRYVRPPAELSGTIDVASLPLPTALAMPFTPPEAAPSAPELTLEQYAHLRAQLAVRGEEDAETLRQFGVGSRAAKEALQARFAAQFRNDPTAQARFVQLVQQRVAELRAR